MACCLIPWCLCVRLSRKLVRYGDMIWSHPIWHNLILFVFERIQKKILETIDWMQIGVQVNRSSRGWFVVIWCCGADVLLCTAFWSDRSSWCVVLFCAVLCRAVFCFVVCNVMLIFVHALHIVRPAVDLISHTLTHSLIQWSLSVWLSVCLSKWHVSISYRDIMASHLAHLRNLISF